MRCAEIHPSLAAFVLGGLESEEAVEVRRHLASCPRCQDELHELQKVNRALRAAPPPATPPAYLRDEILAQVRRAAEPPSSHEYEREDSASSWERQRSFEAPRFNRLKDLRIVLPSVAAAAMVVIVALGVFFGFLREEPPVATIQLVPTSQEAA